LRKGQGRRKATKSYHFAVKRERTFFHAAKRICMALNPPVIEPLSLRACPYVEVTGPGLKCIDLWLAWLKVNAAKARGKLRPV
jgi:hypothetical protein